MKMRLLAKKVFLNIIILNIVLYLASIFHFYVHNKYFLKTVSMETGVYYILSEFIQLFSYMFLSSTINKYGSPYHKIYIKKMRIIYFSYLILPIIHFTILICYHDLKYSFMIYYVVWSLLFSLSTVGYIGIYNNFVKFVAMNVNLCEKLEKEYTLELTEEEIKSIKETKTAIKKLVFAYIIFHLYERIILKSCLYSIVASIIFLLISYSISLSVVRLYNKKTDKIIMLLLSVFTSLRFFIEYEIVSNEIITNIYSAKFRIIRLIFLIPLWGWLDLKKFNSGRYSRYKFKKTAEKLAEKLRY